VGSNLNFEHRSYSSIYYSLFSTKMIENSGNQIRIVPPFILITTHQVLFKVEI